MTVCLGKPSRSRGARRVRAIPAPMQSGMACRAVSFHPSRDGNYAATAPLSLASSRGPKGHPIPPSFVGAGPRAGPPLPRAGHAAPLQGITGLQPRPGTCRIIGIEGRGVRPDAPVASSGPAEATGKADTPRPRGKRGHPPPGGNHSRTPDQLLHIHGRSKPSPPWRGVAASAAGGCNPRRRARRWGVAGEFCAAQALCATFWPKQVAKYRS